MGSPSPLARARAIFTAWEINAKMRIQVIKKKKKKSQNIVVGTLYLYNLCSPVVGAVSEHLACYVEAFKDIESGDNSQSRMWGWACHHMVTYGRTPNTAATIKYQTMNASN